MDTNILRFERVGGYYILNFISNKLTTGQKSQIMAWNICYEVK